MIKMNKKGNLVTDLFIWIGMIFGLALFFGVYIFMGNEIYDVFSTQVAPSLDTDTIDATQMMEDTVGQIPTTYTSLQWISIVIIIGSIITVLLGNFLVRVHPIWVVPYIFIMALAVIFSVPVSNTYQDLLSNELIGSSLLLFNGMNYILIHLPVIVTIIGFLGGVLLFINLPRDRGVNAF